MRRTIRSGNSARNFAGAGIPFRVCPGTSTWNSITGRTANMLANIASAARCGYDAGADGFLLTDWGDGGHHQYWPVSWPGIAAASGWSWNVNAEIETLIPYAVDFAFNPDGDGTLGSCLLEFGRIPEAFSHPGVNCNNFWGGHEPSGVEHQPLSSAARRRDGRSPAPSGNLSRGAAESRSVRPGRRASSSMNSTNARFPGPLSRWSRWPHERAGGSTGPPGTISCAMSSAAIAICGLRAIAPAACGRAWMFLNAFSCADFRQVLRPREARSNVFGLFRSGIHTAMCGRSAILPERIGNREKFCLLPLRFSSEVERAAGTILLLQRPAPDGDGSGRKSRRLLQREFLPGGKDQPRNSVAVVDTLQRIDERPPASRRSFRHRR